MKKYDGFVIDIESDGFIFESTKIWSIVCTDLNDKGRKLKLNPFKNKDAYMKLYEFLTEYDNPYIVFHNGLGFDVFVLMNILGCEHTVGPDTFMGVPVQFVDTFYLSMFLNPDRQGHGVEYFGEKLGLPKIDFRQELIDIGFLAKDAPKGQEFMQYHPLMDVYCDRDTDVNVLIFHGLCKEWKEIYKSDFAHTQAYKCGQKSFYLMSCQELAGWKFDIQKAQTLAVRIGQMMEEIRAEVEPKLPPRSLKKGEEKEYTMPAKPFKKDGSYSSTWDKFVEKHNGKQVGDEWEFYGKRYDVKAGQMLDVKLPMEMANQDQMKDWFISQGWKPTLFNYKRGPDGKPMRDQKTRELVKTTPKIQEAGKICPNLLEMEGDIVKQVVKWLSLRNRQSVLQGWLENPRLQMDGRIGAGRTGIASSHRQKHKTIVNVPKASDKVLLGHEFRDLWTSEDGFAIAAADASALEGRVQAHYCVPMDTQALTRRGWKEFDALTVGEDILAYNPESGMKEWTPLLEKCVFDNAEVFSIENRNFKVRATANHRWFVEYRNTSTGEHIPKVVETKDLNTCCNIIVNAPMQEFQPTSSGILDGKYGINWVERVLSKGLCGVESFMEGFLIADGHYSNQNAVKGGNTQQQGKGRWMFGQNLGEHFNAALTGAYVAHSGYLNVTYRKTKTNVMGIVTLNKKSTITMQRMRVDSIGHERVWCPRTKFGSWVMRQGDVITITGNTYKYDDGATAKDLLEGDIHSKTAKSVYAEELAHIDITAPDFNKDDPFFKPFRDRSKNIFYAGLYGAGDAKIASTAGLPEHRGTEISQKFWEANAATKALKDNLEKYWEQVGQKKYLPAIDKRMLCTRKKSALLNTIFQSCGGIAMDYAGCFMDRWLGEIHWEDRKPYYLYKGYKVRRIGYTHDEYEYEAEEPIAQEVGDMVVKAIVRAGEFLKLQVPLAGEAKVGKSWKDVH